MIIVVVVFRFQFQVFQVNSSTAKWKFRKTQNFELETKTPKFELETNTEFRTHSGDSVFWITESMNAPCTWPKQQQKTRNQNKQTLQNKSKKY